MAIPENIIDQIQQRTDIVEVISRYIPLKKAGRNYKANCPFHNEKTPSFVVSPDRQIFHCFGCGSGGNVFSFLMKHENLQFPEAVEALAEKAGVKIPHSARDEKANSLANYLYKVNEAACRFFQHALSNNASAREYLSSRGVGVETIGKFRIGYAADAWDGMINFFKSKNVDVAMLEKSGLAISNDKGGRYDRFRNRITFPIFDMKDRILGFGARVLDASLPKYMNSPETLIYSKGRNLYGLNFSKEHIKKEGYAVIVEGYLDFIIPFQAGVQNIIATLGTALTVDQIRLLKRFTNTVIMLYDPDEAGETASLRNMDLFISEDVNVYVAELPKGFDPDSFIRRSGAEEFIHTVKSSKNLFDYKINKLSQRFNISSAHGKVAIASEMLPTIAKINNAILKADLVKRLAERLSVDEASIKEELRKVRIDSGERRYAITPTEARKDLKGAEMMILALLLSSGDMIQKAQAAISAADFKDTSIGEMINAIFDMGKDGTPVSPARVISKMNASPQAAYLIAEASSILDTVTDRERLFDDCVTRIKKDNIKERLAALQEEIRSAHARNDEEKVKSLVTQYDELVKTDKILR